MGVQGSCQYYGIHGRSLNDFHIRRCKYAPVTQTTILKTRKFYELRSLKFYLHARMRRCVIIMIVAAQLSVQSQINAQVQQEQQGSDYKITLRSICRLMAMVFIMPQCMAISLGCCVVRPPAKPQQNTGENNDRNFIPMNKIMEQSERSRQQANTHSQTHDCSKSWQNAAKEVRSLGCNDQPTNIATNFFHEVF